MNDEKLDDAKSSNLPTKVTPSKVKRNGSLTKKKKDINKNIINPILKTYNPLISVVLLILMIILIAVTPDAVLPDLITILKGVIQLLTLTTL